MNTVTIKKEKIENFKNVRTQELINADIASVIKVNPQLATDQIEFQKGEIKLLEQQVESLIKLRQNLIKQNNEALLEISNKSGDIKALQTKLRDENEKYKTELSNNHYIRKGIDTRNLVIFAVMLGLLFFMELSVYYKQLACL